MLNLPEHKEYEERVLSELPEQNRKGLEKTLSKINIFGNVSNLLLAGSIVAGVAIPVVSILYGPFRNYALLGSAICLGPGGLLGAGLTVISQEFRRAFVEGAEKEAAIDLDTMRTYNV